MKLAIYLVQLCFYVIGYALYAFYGLLQFITKPGTRFLFPLVIIVLMAFNYAHTLGFAYGVGSAFSQDESWRWILAIISILAALFFLGWFYVYGSRFLGLLLGIFPTINRPLLPVWRPDGPKGPDKRPASVRVVVPPLPPR